jgi:hypothetical protein
VIRHIPSWGENEKIGKRRPRLVRRNSQDAEDGRVDLQTVSVDSAKKSDTVATNMIDRDGADIDETLQIILVRDICTCVSACVTVNQSVSPHSFRARRRRRKGCAPGCS